MVGLVHKLFNYSCYYIVVALSSPILIDNTGGCQMLLMFIVVGF
jgi:hypothetical protein